MGNYVQWTPRDKESATFCIQQWLLSICSDYPIQDFQFLVVRLCLNYRVYKRSLQWWRRKWKVLYEMANNVVVSVFNFWLLEVVLQWQFFGANCWCVWSPSKNIENLKPLCNGYWSEFVAQHFLGSKQLMCMISYSST